jgi:hypothetical protein
MSHPSPPANAHALEALSDMKIFIISSAKTLELRLQADELDAFPSVDTVWFRFDRAVHFDSSRLALAVFLLCSDLIGNVFEVDGLLVPAHLAVVIQRYFPAHELFVHGIDNQPKKIVHPPAFASLYIRSSSIDTNQSPATDQQALGLSLQRTALGYEFIDHEGKTQLSLATNIDLHLALSSIQPQALSCAILYLLCYDTLRPAALVWPRQFASWNTSLVDCIKEVGGDVI